MNFYMVLLVLAFIGCVVVFVEKSLKYIPGRPGVTYKVNFYFIALNIICSL